MVFPWICTLQPLAKDWYPTQQVPALSDAKFCSVPPQLSESTVLWLTWPPDYSTTAGKQYAADTWAMVTATVAAYCPMPENSCACTHMLSFDGWMDGWIDRQRGGGVLFFFFLQWEGQSCTSHSVIAGSKSLYLSLNQTPARVSSLVSAWDLLPLKPILYIVFIIVPKCKYDHVILRFKALQQFFASSSGFQRSGGVFVYGSMQGQGGVSLLQPEHHFQYICCTGLLHKLFYKESVLLFKKGFKNYYPIKWKLPNIVYHIFYIRSLSLSLCAVLDFTLEIPNCLQFFSTFPILQFSAMARFVLLS